jgi:DNA-directed RNA polymerase subunit M/transcription elongation factor TFIIS
MEYDIFCPDCGSFVECGDSSSAIIRDLECPDCGAQFDINNDEDDDYNPEDDLEEIPYDDYKNLDDSN